MSKQRISVELDDETIRCLALLGKPIEVLAHLARSAADGVCRPGHSLREETNEGLRVERNKSDKGVRIARGRADQVVPVLDSERTQPRRLRADFLSTERGATDRHLSRERADADALAVDQREANAQMVSETVRAQDVRDEAAAAQERAEESERELRAVAEFREMFIGILGHDLRNPLGSIVMSATSLLRRGYLNEQDAATATRVIHSSQRMSRMITQLLDLTRARLGGGLPIEPVLTDLRDICRNVVEEFEKTIQLEVEGDLTGTWDSDRLAEVLSNLAGNAIEYAAPGTVVSIKAHADGAEVAVEISNQGAPIPAEVLPFIFAPFRRAKQREKSATGSLGLGLYIAQQIVLSHGGTLNAHSADGTTTFLMRLPRSCGQTLPEPP